MKLEEYQKELYHCFHCHLCNMSNWHRLDEWTPICPSYARFGFESFSASGRIEIARALIENEIDKPTPRLLQIIFSCTGCGACYEQCKDLTGFKAPHVELFEELKARLVDLGWGPLPKQADFARSIQKNHNPYREPHEKRTSWLKKEIPRKAETIYFVGCTSAYRRPEIAGATADVLTTAGVEFGIMHPDEWCCGSPLLRTGQRKIAKDLVKHNVGAIDASGAERVVFSCAGCYKTFKMDYPAILGRELRFDVLHTTEYFSKLVEEGNLKLKNKVSGDITYHDPCHLGRGVGLYDPPRKLLTNMVGSKFIEMKRKREDTWCCGAGGGVKSAFSDFAVWAAAERLREAKATGASTLASSCPFCKHNFMDALEQTPDEFKQLEIRDMSELVAGAAK